MEECIYLSYHFADRVYFVFTAWLHSGERGWHVSGTELRGYKIIFTLLTV